MISIIGFLNNLRSARDFKTLSFFENYGNTLQHFFKNNKFAILYTKPKFFTDLNFLPSQDTDWEFVLLYQGEYGLRVLANDSSGTMYLIFSWNNSLNSPINYKIL